MTKKIFLTLLACPRCKKSLLTKKEKLYCTSCKTLYPFIAGSIPYLLSNKKGVDVRISEKNWDKIYKRHEKGVKENNPMTASHTAFLEKYKSKIKPGNMFLDLGCGIAWQSLVQAKKGVNTVGIDISAEGLVYSKLMFEKDKVQGNFIQADFLSIPLKDNTVDFIYWGLAIEYVKDTSRAVKEAFRVLKPGGRVVAPFPPVSLTTLIYHPLRGGDIPRVPILKEIIEFIHIKALKGKYMNYGYGQTFLVSEMESIFNKEGFSKINTGYFDTYYPLLIIPQYFRSTARRMIRSRLFWPFAFIEAVKK